MFLNTSFADSLAFIIKRASLAIIWALQAGLISACKGSQDKA